MSSSVHVYNKQKDILILVEGPTRVLDDTTLTGEKKYSINLDQKGILFKLALHWSKFVKGTEITKFKAKNLEKCKTIFYCNDIF